MKHYAWLGGKSQRRHGGAGASASAWVGAASKETIHMPRPLHLLVLFGLVASLGACACRPGVIGPYGARPPRCWVW
jgi:hypothetical protein